MPVVSERKERCQASVTGRFAVGQIKSFFIAAALGTIGITSTQAAAPSFVAQLPPQGTDLNSWPLGEMRRFAVYIDPLPDFAKKCGLTESRLEGGLRLILGQSAMNIVSAVSDYDASIRVRANFLDVGCVGNIRLSVVSPTVVLRNKRVDSSVIWENGFVMTGTADPGSHAESIIKELAAKLVNDWNTANPRTP